MTLIELMAFAMLFTAGFIPGHLVAQRAGMFPGLLTGVGAAVVFSILSKLLMACLTPKKK